MAIASDLLCGFNCEPSNLSSIDVFTWGYGCRVEMTMELETAIEFWSLSKDVSTEAAKVYGMFPFAVMRTSITSSIEPMPDLFGNETSHPHSAFSAREQRHAGADDQPDMDWVRNFKFFL